jgi:hypothetical protein
VRLGARSFASQSRRNTGVAHAAVEWQGSVMAERTSVVGIIGVALWRGGVGDGSEARRASSLYVAIFLLWPLAAIAAGLVSLLLVWLGRTAAQIGFLVTFGCGLIAPFVWQWWEHSPWRLRRRVARDTSFLPLIDITELVALADGQPVRVRGRVRACTAFESAAAPAGAPATTVYEQVHAHDGAFGSTLWYELGCDFEIVDQTGQTALVRLAGGQVLPLRTRRVDVRGREAVLRVLARMPPSTLDAPAPRHRPSTRLITHVHDIRDGDEVEITACKLPVDHRAVLHRESALRPAMGAHANIAPIVTVTAERAVR